jgi:serine/threonine protein kinase
LIALADALRDRYVLGRELGRGGMATVYAAQDVRHNRQVAVKVLHQNLAATLGPERFEREIQLAAAANWDELKTRVIVSLDSLDRQVRARRPDAKPMGGAGPS